VSRWSSLVLLLAAAGTSVSAQSIGGWTWSAEGTAFVGVNVQHRSLFGVEEFESENWASAGAERGLRGGTLTLSSILSLEPLTLRSLGSAQVFQFGGSYLGGPVVDHAHPRDLVSGLGAAFSRAIGAISVRLEGDLVGAPALGPAGFENRPTASLNPAAPLSREHLDSTDASSGVLLVGLQASGASIEASAFRGRGPDEHRFDLNLGALDSWAVRASYTRAGWTSQVSSGVIHQPEIFEPYDVRRTTASIGFAPPGRAISWMAAWGEDRDRYGVLDAYLVDAALRLSPRQRVYARLEIVANDFLDAGYHLQRGGEVIQVSTVTAFTGGYVRDLGRGVGVGADATFYDVPSSLSANYVSVYSAHLFVRLHGASGARPR
jgi:hypothetical protein